MLNLLFAAHSSEENRQSFKAVVGETAHSARGVGGESGVGNSSRCKREVGGCDGEVGVRGSSDAVSDPQCVTKVLAEAQKHKKAEAG